MDRYTKAPNEEHLFTSIFKTMIPVYSFHPITKGTF